DVCSSDLEPEQGAVGGTTLGRDGQVLFDLSRQQAQSVHEHDRVARVGAEGVAFAAEGQRRRGGAVGVLKQQPPRRRGELLAGRNDSRRCLECTLVEELLGSVRDVPAPRRPGAYLLAAGGGALQSLDGLEVGAPKTVRHRMPHRGLSVTVTRRFGVPLTSPELRLVQLVALAGMKMLFAAVAAPRNPKV